MRRSLYGLNDGIVSEDTPFNREKGCCGSGKGKGLDEGRYRYRYGRYDKLVLPL